MNLPWLGSPTEAAEPHQRGGSESPGFRSGGCPPCRRLGLIRRTNRTRLCRMGTRRRQFACRRFHAFLPGTRRSRSVTRFHAFRISLRRVMSVVHFHAFRRRPRGIDSVRHDHGFAPGFRRIPSLVRGASTLLSCFRKNWTVCRGKSSTLAV
jgi:hypothetical protein